MSPDRRLRISPWLCLLGSFLLLTVPLPWLVAWAAAAGVHELGHLLAIRLLGGRVEAMELSPGGAVLEASGLHWAGELAATLAGPICGFLLLGLAHRFPRLAICALVQSCYNLLPVFPLDGGRMLRCLLRRFLRPAAAEGWSRGISLGTAVLLLLIGWGLLRHPLAILVPLLLFLRNRSV